MEAVKREDGTRHLCRGLLKALMPKKDFSLVALWPCGLLPLGLSDTLSTPRRGKKIAGLKFLIAAFHKS